MLKVGNKEVQSTKVTYEDLIILYKQFINTYGEVPVYSKCDSKHNMPQGRIITRVLKEIVSPIMISCYSLVRYLT